VGRVLEQPFRPGNAVHVFRDLAQNIECPVAEGRGCRSRQRAAVQVVGDRKRGRLGRFNVMHEARHGREPRSARRVEAPASRKDLVAPARHDQQERMYHPDGPNRVDERAELVRSNRLRLFD
jgi:hypothetical protein